MPQAAPHNCTAVPRCPNLAPRGQGPCDQHAAERAAVVEQERGSSHDRGYGQAWRKKRARIIERDPVCRVCLVSWSKQVDHVIPKKLGGTDADANLQGICVTCHQEKSAKETAFGKGGDRGGKSYEPFRSRPFAPPRAHNPGLEAGGL